MSWFDLFGQVFFGWGSVLAIILLYRHADDFSDGNVGAGE